MLTCRTAGVVNLAHAAMGSYVAFAYFEFRDRGDLVLPVFVVPDRIHLLRTPTLAAALLFALVLAAALGLVAYVLVFRPLRRAPTLARTVASLGLYLYLQEVVRLKFAATGVAAANRFPVLPERPVRLLGTNVSANRLILAGAVVVVTAVLGVVLQRTRVGLATRAAAGNEKGAVLIGISPDRVAAPTWALASVLGGFAVILIEPIAGLDPVATPLLVVPALAAALLGGLRSLTVTVAAGLGIGAVQSLVLGHAVRPDTTWIPEWLPTTGLQQTVPLVLVIVAIAWRGDPLPSRSAIVEHRLPRSPTPRHVAVWTMVLGGSAAVGLLTFDAPLRQALIVTLTFTLLALSVVVVTGYVGQVSLAPVTIAGVAGFTAIDLADQGAPFALAVLVATGVAALVGVIVAVPATRVRGMTLAVATLAAAVAVEHLVLGSTALSGGAGGRRPPRPDLFGLDVGISAPGADNFRPAYGFVVLVVVVAAAVAVANLRRNRTGLRWLAVRANERAAAAAGIDVARAKIGAFAVSSALAGLAGSLMAFGATTLSTSSFLVIGSLVALALTYLAGVAGVGGAVVAGLLAQAGLVTALSDRWGGGDTGTHVHVVSGLALIVTVVAAPEGLTGMARRVVARGRGAAPRRGRGDDRATTGVAPEGV